MQRVKLQLPAASHLEKIEEPHVTLLFFGGRDEKKAAQKAGRSLAEFADMNSTLSAREGELVSFTAHTVFVHPEVVFVSVSLPTDLPCDNQQPYVKLRASPSADGSIVRSILERGLFVKGIPLPEPVLLSGRIEMETGEPLPGARQCRPPRLADESQGAWVHVKKHNSMCCAVIRFPSSEIRDAVLDQARAAAFQFAQYPGISFDMRPHQEKLDGGAREVLDALFIAWKTPHGRGYGSRGYDASISATDLQLLFDSATAPLMATCWRGEADVADGLLRSKTVAGAQSGTGSSSDEVVVVRLTRMARSPQVTHLLLQSPVLEPCRLRVRQAGCDIMPLWAAGAKIFVPSIQPQDVAEAGVKLQDHHLILYRSDVHLLQEVLAEMPCRQRPKISHEQDMGRRRNRQTHDHEDHEEPVFVVVCNLRTNSSLGPNSSCRL